MYVSNSLTLTLHEKRSHSDSKILKTWKSSSFHIRIYIRQNTQQYNLLRFDSSLARIVHHFIPSRKNRLFSRRRIYSMSRKENTASQFFSSHTERYNFEIRIPESRFHIAERIYSYIRMKEGFLAFVCVLIPVRWEPYFRPDGKLEGRY